MNHNDNEYRKLLTEYETAAGDSMKLISQLRSAQLGSPEYQQAGDKLHDAVQVQTAIGNRLDRLRESGR